MNTELTYATVCSGIECMSVAAGNAALNAAMYDGAPNGGAPNGLPLRPVFFAEIEPFPCAVLKAHYPDVPNLGDMSRIEVHPVFVEPTDPAKPHAQLEVTNGTTAIRLEHQLDILAGGTPCQDVSVAGKRAGMQEGSGTRSSLAFEFVRLARELRPRYILWENVAGCIDSRNAPDFLRFASALGDCGYACAWRVLDAQYVRVDGVERAVPQRRRRVWLVGCLGDDGRTPAQILFEPDCIVGDTPPRRVTGKGFAYSLARCHPLDARLVEEPAARPAGTRDDRRGINGGCGSFDPFPNGAIPGGGMTEQVAQPIVNGACPGHHNCIALEGNGQRPSHKGSGVNADGASFTLNRIEQHVVAYGYEHYEAGGQNQQPVCIGTEASLMRYIVRRLTPTECERLQGIPDGYTIPAGLAVTDALVAEFQRIFDAFGAIMADYAHKPRPAPKSANFVRKWLEKITDPAACPDSPRYKALGNGWACNCARWILMRLVHFDRKENEG